MVFTDVSNDKLATPYWALKHANILYKYDILYKGHGFMNIFQHSVF